jgi:CTP:molybdopterin cytidylyltransferase MocA/xanthine/CO dehydrogenase XdhC/CoxF family maturation factor
VSVPAAPRAWGGPAPADLLAVAARLSSEGVAFALVTVVRAAPPTSAKPGDKAILTESGEWLGWVGGSCAEPTARRAAARALADGQCRLVHLTNDETDLVRPGVELAAMTCHSGGSLEIYVEPHLSDPRLIVFGRSPIAQAVCELGRLLAYRPIAVDLGANERGLEALEALPGGRRLVVVASHGHFELEALTWALQSDAAYVGLVTSQSRLPDVLARLRAQGVSPGQLERLRAPAGLSIGATRPAEVALSILSQVVSEGQASLGAVSAPAAHGAPEAHAASTGGAPAEATPAPNSPARAAVTVPAGPPSRARRSCCDVQDDAPPVAAPAAAPPALSGAAPAQRFAAVVLAAGLSRRMGAQNKLLLPVAGEPMIRRVVGNVLAAGFVEVVVVLGHQADDVRRALAPLGVRCVVNADFESGQVSSVRAGLAALTQPADAVMVCLGDQPLLGSADLDRLRVAYGERPQGSILVPMRGNRRGNPVLLDWQSARETLERGTNFGCRQFMDENPERVYRWQAPNDHYVRDVDAPEDYQAAIQQPLE